MYQRSLYQSMRSQAVSTLRRLGRHEAGTWSRSCSRQDELLSRFAAVTGERISGQRIRLHGDFHLGQVPGPAATSS